MCGSYERLIRSFRMSSRMPSSIAATETLATEHNATRERLLDVAERLFAERGFAATSVRAITAAAETNLAAVNYHFGSKRGLYVELFRHRLAATRDRRISTLRAFRESAGVGASLEGLLESFASAFVDHLVEGGPGPRFAQLMLREMADPELPPGFFESEMVAPVRSALGEAMVAVEPDLDQRRVPWCIQSFIAQLLHVVRMTSYCQRAPGAPAAPPLPPQIAHVVRFSAAGVRAAAGGSSAVGRRHHD